MDYVKYIDRTRDYYLSQGYEKPYEWAHFDDVPFSKLKKPLSECKIALASTSDFAVKGGEVDHVSQQAIGNVYSIPADTPAERIYSQQEHYDIHATNLDDPNTYFPLTLLRKAAADGLIAGVAARAHGVYYSYSHRRTLENDGPELLKRCLEDGVDAVVLTPV